MRIARRALGTVGARTPLAHAILSTGAHVGVTPYNWQLLRSTRRLGLYRSRPDRVPRPPWQARPARKQDPADLALCERLLVAYSAALRGRPPAEQVSGMWQWIYDQRQLGLAGILERGDAQALAAELATMFRKPFMHGLAPGSLVSHSESALGRRIWQMKTLDSFISLAEALGVVPVDGPEQGAGRRVFDGGLEQLTERVEAALGFSIDFPDVGAPYGWAIGQRLLTLESPEQIYSAVRLEQALRSQLRGRALAAPRVVEIGGGYGATCMWFLRGGRGLERYVIVDLPIINVLQGYFLSRSLGAHSVSLFGEPSARVVIAPDVALDSIEVPYDVLVNKDSMPEMPAGTMQQYLSWASTTCTGIFFSCNHESSASFLGDRQGLVPEAMARAGSFARVRRDESWVRRGYVEEIYARKNGADGC